MPIYFLYVTVFYTTGLLTLNFPCVILLAENREATPPGKEIQMFRLSFVKTVYKYELHELLRNDYDYESIIKVRSYETGKTKRLDIPD